MRHWIHLKTLISGLINVLYNGVEFFAFQAKLLGQPPVITGKVEERTRDLIHNVCQTNEAEILAEYVGKYHIHLLVSVPPHLSARKLLQYINKYT